MFRIIVIPEAASDINQASEWYLKEGDEFVSRRFKKHLVNAIEQLQNTNIEHAVVYRGLNRVFVKRFPYTIYFKRNTIDHLIIIYAVLHNKQHKKILSSRL